jgi:hypothetical protein
MKYPSKKLLLLSAIPLLWSNAVVSEQSASSNNLAEPPGISDDAEMEPEVHIIQHEDKTIEEFRLHGQLFKIKVTPKNAPPYYLIDTDGDGMMDARRTEIEPNLMIPRWVLFRW